MSDYAKCKSLNALQKLIIFGKTLALLVIISITIMVSGVFHSEARASGDVGNVMVWTTNLDYFGSDARPYFPAVSKFYQDNNATVTTISKGHLSSNSLEGISLLWVFLPYEDFTANDITYMSDFLAAGGRIVFCGEHVGYFAQGNIYISNAVAKLGGTFSVLAENSAHPGGGLVSGSCIIRESNLTNGLTGYHYAAAAKMSYSGSTQAVVTDLDRVPLVVDQAVGNGRITLFTDVNVWDYILNPNPDPEICGNNEVLFLNLLTDAKANQDILEEGGNPNAGFGGSPVYTITAGAASFEPASTLKYTFTVEYRTAEGSDAIFDSSQFDDNDVTVKNTNGISCIVRKDTSIGGGSGIVSGAGTNDVVVQYTVSAPDGTWDIADGGSYTIGIVNAAVKDSNNKQIAGNTSAAAFPVTVSETAELTGVTISGTAQVGETLTAAAAPGSASVSYQWKADGINVGTDKATYLVQASDLGKTITVTITGTGIYTGEFTSTATNAVIAGKTPVISVSIEDAEQVEVGQILSATVAPAGATVNYQWKAGLSSVGTNTESYTVQAADLGKTITVTVTGTDQYKGKVTSPATGEVTAAKTPLTNVEISGMAMLGQTLTATVTPTGAAVSYQWKADGIEIGTNASTYTVQAADLGKIITVTAKGTGIYKGTVTSTATSEVTAAITVKINNGAETGGASLSGVIGSTPVNTITSVEITGGIVTTNDWNYIRNLYVLTDFKIADTVTSVANVPNYSYGISVFPASLKTVELAKTAGIGYAALNNCTNLTSAVLSAVTMLESSAFNNCSSLADLKLPAVPPAVANYTVFYGCPADRYLEFTDENGAALTGAELTSAQNAYKAVNDGNTNDTMWYGWRIMPPTPVTSVSINGSARVGEILEAAVEPEGAAVTWQWKVNGANVGSNTETYTVQPADFGKTITVTATGTGDYRGTAASEATSPVTAARTPIYGISMSGDVQVDEILTAAVNPEGATVTWQWKADGSNVGTDSATYTVQAADFGKVISVTATGIDNYKGAITVNAAYYVIAAKTRLTNVTISGTAMPGENLTAAVTPAGAAATYQWKADGIEVGTNSATYTVQTADIGKAITVTATGTGDCKGTVTSEATSPVTEAKTPVEYVSISGTAQVGEIITATVYPSDATVTYEWKANQTVVGTDAAYTIKAEDLGKTITVTVAGTGDYTGTVTSAATSIVTGGTTPPPVTTPITSVSVSGSAIVGETLTAAVTPEGATAAYQWKADGADTGNGMAYTIQAQDFGKTITVTATGTGDYSGTVTSAATSIVTGGTTPPPVTTPITAVSVSGSAIVGETLTAAVIPEGATAVYQWKADGADTGTGMAYTIQAQDLGKTITVTATGTGDYSGTVISAATSAVTGGTTPPPAQQTELDKAKAAAWTKNAAEYTPDSWSKLMEALALPETTDEEALAKTAAIYNAIAGLVKVTAPADTFMVNGIIRDSNNNPVSGATVVLTDINDITKIYFDITDINGNYIISGVPNGNYTITVIKNGESLGGGSITVNGNDVSGGSGNLTVTPISTPIPVPEPTPSPAPAVEHISIDVKQGSTDNTITKITIERSTDEKGNKSDKVTYEEERAKETVENLKNQGNDVARIVIPDSDEEITRTTVDIPSDTLDIIAKGEINIQIDTEKAKIDIPKQTLQKVNDSMKENLYFNLVPVKNEDQKQEIEKRAVFEAALLKEDSGDTESSVKVICEPVTIETNMPSSPVDITLPLTGISIPADPVQKEAFLNQLAVYIEHSDGDKELVKGEIVEYKNGMPGIRFHITKFSIFTVVKTDVFAKSSECELIGITEPAGSVISGTDITATVPNKVSSIIIKAEVSDKAVSGLYSDKACTKELADHKLNLKTGENKAYLKVMAEDTTIKIYTVKIIRSKAAAADITKIDIPQKAVMKGNTITVTAAPGTDALTMKVKTSGNATWKLYGNKACTKELSDRQMKLKDGVNTAYLKVTAEDGRTSKVYTIKVLREAAPAAQYSTHVKLGLIGSRTYAREVAKIFEKDYDCDNVQVKKEGNYYRVYMDFTGKAAARTACKDMIAREYIVNYYFYVK